MWARPYLTHLQKVVQTEDPSLVFWAYPTSVQKSGRAFQVMGNWLGPENEPTARVQTNPKAVIESKAKFMK